MERLAALLSIDLATLADDQLVAHRQAVHAAAVEGRAAGNLNTDSLSLLRAAVDVVRQVDEEIDLRNVGAAALAEEADAALSELTVAASRRPSINRALTVPDPYPAGNVLRIQVCRAPATRPVPPLTEREWRT